MSKNKKESHRMMLMERKMKRMMRKMMNRKKMRKKKRRMIRKPKESKEQGVELSNRSLLTERRINLINF